MLHNKAVFFIFSFFHNLTKQIHTILRDCAIDCARDCAIDCDEHIHCAVCIHCAMWVRITKVGQILSEMNI